MRHFAENQRRPARGNCIDGTTSGQQFIDECSKNGYAVERAPGNRTANTMQPLGKNVRALIALMIGTCGGCSSSDSGTSEVPSQVVMYCSVDETYARPIVEEFSKKAGIEVSAIYDSEAGKTTGLVNRVIAEARAGRPVADVFWSGELFGTMRLAELGLLQIFDPPQAAGIPPRFRDSLNRWTALAVRARVVAFDPQQTPAETVPSRWEDFATPDIAPHVAIANPLFGTTRGHVAAMFAVWGPGPGKRFLQNLEGKALVLDGNSATVRAVMDGRMRYGFTDSDDVWAARRAGATLEFKMPDMGDGGTLLIPCSVAIVKGGPNPDPARKLADYLVSAEVERLLARSESRNIPVRQALRDELRMDWPAETKIGFNQILKQLDASDAGVREILVR